MRISIMQPYFIPYAGYFRLFSTTDVFVLYDCVQFPRRGWVHRNQILTPQGNHKWLTLPIAKCPQSTRIQDLTFSQEDSTWGHQIMNIKGCTPNTLDRQTLTTLYTRLSALPLQVVDFLQDTLEDICGHLSIPKTIVRSSTLNIDPELKGQDRILAICHNLGATTYINSPGGRDLYQPEAFHRHGIDLEFLKSYEGGALSILQRLLLEDKDQIRHEIYSQSSFV
jgi:WbqC-like protein family